MLRARYSNRGSSIAVLAAAAVTISPTAVWGEVEHVSENTVSAAAVSVPVRLYPPLTEERPVEPLVGDSAAGLPGLHRVAAAAHTPSLAVVNLSAGYGFTGAVLDDRDAHHRTSGSLAVGIRPLPWLGFAVRLDSRYDRHSAASVADDDSMVTEPRLTARAIRRMSPTWNVGGELRMWVPPSGSGPSLDFAATTADLVMLSTVMPDERVTLAVNLGFRLDRSAASVAEADRLSRADRMSLGVSDSDAVLLGLGGAWRSGPLELFAEGSWDVLIGEGAPAPLSSPLRLGAGARLQLHTAVQLQFLAETSPGRRPLIETGQPLVPVEPGIQVMAAVAYHSRAAKKTPPAAAVPMPEPAPEAPEPVAIEPFELPVVEPPDLDDVVAADAAQEADDEVLSIYIPGYLRGATQSFQGQVIAATSIRIEPLDIDVPVAEDGTFEIELPPGSYTVVITAPGFVDQRLETVIESDAVRIVNVDLRRKRGGKDKR